VRRALLLRIRIRNLQVWIWASRQQVLNPRQVRQHDVCQHDTRQREARPQAACLPAGSQQCWGSLIWSPQFHLDEVATESPKDQARSRY